jgi:hypothetical protein
MLEKKFQRIFLQKKDQKVRMTVYVDADHAHDLVTGILFMTNSTPIRWIYKHQKTVETSTYGSEMAPSRISTKLILEVMCMLRSLGVPLDGTALMSGNNMSIVLKKKHNATLYRQVREAISARIMRFSCIKSEENVSDVLKNL